MSAILSIIIPSHNDTAECIATVQSAIGTTSQCEIIVVDDCSQQPVPTSLFGARVFRTARRIGVGPARTLGAWRATGQYLLFVDSHCRFSPGWYEAALQEFLGKSKTAYCASCLGLTRENMDLTKHSGAYYGATYNFCGPDKQRPNRNQVFEVIWQPEKPGDGYELPAMMGACYFFPREWFLHLNPLRFLRSWGVDEAAMSLKCWLAGGEIRMLKGVKIGHQFRTKGIQQIAPWHALYNKLFSMHTILPADMAKLLESKMERGGLMASAKKALFDDWHLVETEKAYNDAIFNRRFVWLLEKFQLSFPQS